MSNFNTESSLYLEAFKAYIKAVESNGRVYQQPAQDATEIGRKYVSLYNCNGRLARYKIRTKEIILG